MPISTNCDKWARVRMCYNWLIDGSLKGRHPVSNSDDSQCSQNWAHFLASAQLDAQRLQPLALGIRVPLQKHPLHKSNQPHFCV